MQIDRITVTAGRTIPDPNVKFSNFRPDIALAATLGEGDDPVVATRRLQALAEALMDEHWKWLIGGRIDGSNRTDEASGVSRFAMDKIKGVNGPF